MNTTEEEAEEQISTHRAIYLQPEEQDRRTAPILVLLWQRRLELMTVLAMIAYSSMASMTLKLPQP